MTPSLEIWRETLIRPFPVEGGVTQVIVDELMYVAKEAPRKSFL